MRLTVDRRDARAILTGLSLNEALGESLMADGLAGWIEGAGKDEATP